MSLLALAPAALTAAADWTAVWFERRRLGWLTKPAVLLMLLAGFSLAGGWHAPLTWFGLALVFCLVGDILLMLPARAFIFGLAAFLLGHICYTLFFTLAHPPPLRAFIPALALVTLLSWPAFVPVFRALRRKAYGMSFMLPMTLYSLVLSLMLASALSLPFNPAWRKLPALLCAAGAALFYLSDVILSHNRFAQSIPRARFWTRLPYHSGQILLTAGALLQFAVQ